MVREPGPNDKAIRRRINVSGSEREEGGMGGGMMVEVNLRMRHRLLRKYIEQQILYIIYNRFYIRM
jgi:hypothetical protein